MDMNDMVPAPATDAMPRPLMRPGQAAAPAGPVDVNNMYVFHHGFRRDLGNFIKTDEHTPVEVRITWQALSARWKGVATELHRHHEHEDAALWPILLSRVDDDGRAVLGDMQDEHASIDPILAECGAGFTRLAASPDQEARATLLEHLTSGQACLDGHLAHEECAAIPLIQEFCTRADWAAFEKAAQKDTGLGGLLHTVPWAAHGLDASVRGELLAGLPRVMTVVWRITNTRFEKQEQKAFRYV